MKAVIKSGELNTLKASTLGEACSSHVHYDTKGLY